MVTPTLASWRSRVPNFRAAGIAGPCSLAIALVWVVIVVPLTGRQNDGMSTAYLALQAFSFVGLLALALAVTVLAGELDLSIVGMFAFGGGTAIKLGGQRPLLGILGAVAVGLMIGIGQGLAVSRLRLNSMMVTLGTYIALLGATSILGDGQAIPYNNFDPGLILDRPILGIFSLHSLVAIGLFVAVGAIMRYTRGGRDLYAVGNDRRAAGTAGVRVGVVLVVVFAFSGAIAALAGSLQAYSTASASPDPGTGVFVLVTSAVLLGGIAIEGGEGSLVGVASAALALSLLQQLTGIFAVQGYVSDVLTGAILIITATATAPKLRVGWRTLRPARTRKDQNASNETELVTSSAN